MIPNLFTKEPLHSIIIKQVKKPLVALLVGIDGLLPNPTQEMVRLKNTKLLIDLRDWTLSHIAMESRVKPIRAMWNLLIIVYDYDSPYTDAIDQVLGKFIERIGEWKFTDHVPDSRFWKL